MNLDPSIPRWISVAHSIAVYGMSADESEALKEVWSDHLAEWSADEQPSLAARVGKVTHGALSHIWWRMRSGQATAIPAGVFVVLGALSSASFAVSDSDSELPTWTHIVLACTLLIVGASLLGSPRLDRPRLLVPSALLNATAIVLIMTQVSIDNALDVAVFGGFVLFAVGSVQFAFSLMRSEPAIVRGQLTLAGASVLIGVGNAGWTRIADDPSYILSCAVSALVALTTGYSVSRLGHITFAGNT